MSAAALFIPTTDQGAGSYYVPVSVRIAELPRDLRPAADAVWKAIMDFLPRGKTQFTITDRMLRQSRWLRDYSYRFLQKGLWVLEHVLGVIERHRAHGRRTIVVLDRLRGRTRPTPKSKQGDQARPDGNKSLPQQNQPRTVNLQERRAAAEVALGRLQQLGWSLRTQEGKLYPVKLRGNATPITEGLASKVREFQPELIELLRQRE
jgi:hypothetical protein